MPSRLEQPPTHTLRARRFADGSQEADIRFLQKLFAEPSIKRQMYALPLDTKGIFYTVGNTALRRCFILETGTDVQIGFFTITKLPDIHRGLATFGIGISEEHQGRGWGKLAMALLEDEAKKFEVTTLRADVYADNRASLEMLRGAGYRDYVLLEKNLG